MPWSDFKAVIPSGVRVIRLPLCYQSPLYIIVSIKHTMTEFWTKTLLHVQCKSFIEHGTWNHSTNPWGRNFVYCSRLECLKTDCRLSGTYLWTIKIKHYFDLFLWWNSTKFVVSFSTKIRVIFHSKGQPRMKQQLPTYKNNYSGVRKSQFIFLLITIFG